ncbi:MAG TPA: glycosyltransferase family 25 protein [Burkholderiales bacterium]|jgi:GR25 family glycosyltransferase involved in LPS biosynthesis
MECYYINLRKQAQRREFLEKNFARYKRPGWYLNRVKAVDSQQVAAADVPGAIRQSEKGCFLSHRLALKAALEAPGHSLILEDDAMFGPSSCAAIEGALHSMGEEGWDLAYTDLGIYHPPLMAAMLHMRKELAGGEADHLLMDARELTFAGATAYIVHQRFKQPLLELLEVPALDRPYDVFLRDLLLAGRLRARVIFPFPTSLSPLADFTQIQESDAVAADRVFNSFRRFIWKDRDIQDVFASLDTLPPDFIDEEAEAFARIIGAAVSSRLKLG